MSALLYSKIQKKDIWKIKTWRNMQMHILRQNIKLTNKDQERWWKQINTNQILFSIKRANMLIGYCGFVHIDNYNKKAEISFVLNPVISIVEHNKIYHDTLKLLIEVGFYWFGFNRLTIEAFSNRKNIFGVVESAGFKCEGILCKNVLKNSQYLNSYLFAIVK